MSLPEELYIQEHSRALWVNRSAEGAAEHPGVKEREIGVYRLERRVRVVTSIEDVPPGEKAAQVPQD